jgi:signal transduction histidine kinase
MVARCCAQARQFSGMLRDWRPSHVFPVPVMAGLVGVDMPDGPARAERGEPHVGKRLSPSRAGTRMAVGPRQATPVGTFPGQEIVHDGEFDAARRRMLDYAALTEHLVAPVEPPGLACRVLSTLRDDVEALAVYVETPDGVATLLSHAGFGASPPAHADAAAVIGGREVVDLAGSAGPRRLHVLGAHRPAWIGDRAVALAVAPFGGAQPKAKRGLVLYTLRAGDHGPSLVALLELGAQGIAGALARDKVPVGEQGGEPAMRTRVLLIDGEGLPAGHIKGMLEHAGFAFHSARTACEGLALATSIRPDVILIDNSMPGPDGTELLRLMRQHELLGTVPVIMLSGQADEAACVAAWREGADNVVIKPFSAQELIARIEGTVRLLRLRRDVVWREGELLRLRQSQQELRTLLDTVQRVRDDERRMLAREVHDQLGQILTAAKIDIRLLQLQLDKAEHPLAAAEISKEIGAALSSVDLAIAAVQNISALLRPPALEQGGLVAALRWQAKEMQRRTGIECSVKHDPGGYLEPSPFVAGELLRMCQEALTNVLRHAGATRVVLQVAMRGPCLLVRICDDGVGITPTQARDPASIGLKGMSERAACIRASVHIHGKRGRGTMVAIRRRLGFR